jgi:hypothetical protein
MKLSSATPIINSKIYFRLDSAQVFHIYCFPQHCQKAGRKFSFSESFLPSADWSNGACQLLSLRIRSLYLTILKSHQSPLGPLPASEVSPPTWILGGGGGEGVRGPNSDDCWTETLILYGEKYNPGGHKEMSSILADQ